MTAYLAVSRKDVRLQWITNWTYVKTVIVMQGNINKNPLCPSTGNNLCTVFGNGWAPDGYQRSRKHRQWGKTGKMNLFNLEIGELWICETSWSKTPTLRKEMCSMPTAQYQVSSSSSRGRRLICHWKKSVLDSGKGFLTSGLHKLLIEISKYRLKYFWKKKP